MRRGGGGGAPSECLATPLLMFVGVGRFNYDRGFLCQLSVPPQKPGRVWKEWVMRNSWAESVSNTSWSGEQVRMEVTLVLYLWIASQSLGMAQRLRRSLGSGRVLECFFLTVHRPVRVEIARRPRVYMGIVGSCTKLSVTRNHVYCMRINSWVVWGRGRRRRSSSVVYPHRRYTCTSVCAGWGAWGGVV